MRASPPAALAATMLLCWAPAQVAAQDLPTGLRDVLFGGRKMPKHSQRFDNDSYQVIRDRQDRPCIAWPKRAGRSGPRQERQAVAQFLRRNAGALWPAGVQARFVAQADWHGVPYWEYELWLRGRPVMDAWLRIYWDGQGRLLGFWNNHVHPGLGIDPSPRAPRPNERWFAEYSPQGYRWVLARLARRKEGKMQVTEVRTAKGLVNTLYQPPASPTIERALVTEYQIASGSFPDQIYPDATGRLWYSQPNQNQISVFDPRTQKFQAFPTGRSRGPDGLFVDAKDRVWTGCYFSNELGVFDIPTKTYRAITMPYSPSAPAIPLASVRGSIWVTDHAYNRVSEFDPETNKWLGSHVMPRTRVWVTAGCLDPARDDMYFTEYIGHALGHKPLNKPLVEIPDPNNGGPAFCVFHDDVVYYSLWNQNRLGAYNVRTKKVRTYTYPVAREASGPLGVTPNGDVVVGTRSVGYLMVVTPSTGNIRAVRIPSASSRLKDGLCVAPDGSVWFTESGISKIARLKLP